MEGFAVDTEKLIEAREQTDRGIRLAVPRLAEAIGIGQSLASPVDAPGELEAETVEAIGKKLGRVREEAQGTGVLLPFDGQEDLHLRLNGVVNEVDRIAAILAERSTGTGA